MKQEINQEKIRSLLLNQPWNYALHQMLALLEATTLNKAMFGNGKNPNDEAAILKAYCSFSIPSSDCVKFQIKNGNQYLTINQTSLVGINGILPQRYSEIILSKMKENQSSAIDFLDIFHQRIFGMMHKIEKKTQIHLNRNWHDNFIYCHALSGMLHKKQTLNKLNNHEIYENIFPSFASFLWQKNKSPNGLIAILKSMYPNLTIKIQQFIATWIEIDEANQAKLNKDSLNNKMLGKKALCAQNTIKIIITVQNMEEYNQMMPNTKNFILLQETARYYLPAGFNAQFEIIVQANEEICMLNNTHKLGYNTWAGKNLGKMRYHGS